MNARMNESQERIGLAKASGLLARPWTLLIIDRLADGPLRFTEIAVSLRGISTNLLAERLRVLTTHDVVQRSPGPATSRYELTERGRAVLPVVEILSQWGEQFL